MSTQDTAGTARGGSEVMDASETTRLRALREAATPGPWEVYMPGGGGHGVACGDPRRAASCLMRTTGHGTGDDAALIVAAVNALPALLDRAEAAEKRVRELEAQGLALAEDARAAYAQRREMGREAQRLREIIAGRTTPPTDAEIEAHAAAGGLWRFLGLRGFALSADCAPAEDAIIPRALGLRTGIARRWWALDADGVPCAWPTAEVSRG